MSGTSLFGKKDLSRRFGLIDEIRGFAILCMVVYHGVYDLIMFMGIDIPAFSSPLMNFIRDVFAGGFILISGTACRFSHNNLKRGAVCFGLGLIMTAVTWLMMPDQLIAFGILHCLGICMMLFPLFSRLMDKTPTWLGVSVLAFLFLLTNHIYDGYLGIEGVLSIPLPKSLYTPDWLFAFGFPNPDFFSTDYFPLLPWLFIFLLGGYLGRWMKEGNPPEWIKKTHLRPLAFVGRNTLWIYLLHQPVLFGVMLLIGNFL